MIDYVEPSEHSTGQRSRSSGGTRHRSSTSTTRTPTAWLRASLKAIRGSPTLTVSRPEPSCWTRRTGAGARTTSPRSSSSWICSLATSSVSSVTPGSAGASTTSSASVRIQPLRPSTQPSASCLPTRTSAAWRSSKYSGPHAPPTSKRWRRSHPSKGKRRAWTQFASRLSVRCSDGVPMVPMLDNQALDPRNTLISMDYWPFPITPIMRTCSSGLGFQPAVTGVPGKFNPRTTRTGLSASCPHMPRWAFAHPKPRSQGP